MFRYWVGEAYCHADTVVGLALIYVILLVQKLWTIIGGIALVKGELYLAVLVFWGYWEGIFIHYTLSLKFNESRPNCATTFNYLVAEHRLHAMPSLEAQLIFTVSFFLLANMLLVKRAYPMKILVMIVTLPVVASGALLVTHNNTVGQLAFGALIGAVNGLRHVLLYQFFLKYVFEHFATLVLFKWFLPSGDIVMMDQEKYEDQDTLMFKRPTTTPAAARTLADFIVP